MAKDPKVKEQPHYESYDDYLKSKQWAFFRERRKEIDYGMCALCGHLEGLHVHHLRYPKVWGTEAVEDLLTVCEICHGLLHSKYEWVLDLVRFNPGCVSYEPPCNCPACGEPWGSLANGRRSKHAEDENGTPAAYVERVYTCRCEFSMVIGLKVVSLTHDRPTQT